ncbi:MAG: sterol desaturase family protein, partial [Gammaproteobacteria bacterium]|nr:sterol desaturase family protein [Gammaproteobacteria bacterium]
MDLTELVMQNEKEIRMGFFFGMLAIIGIWEIIAPRRALTVSKGIRWANNLGLVFFNSFVTRLIFPAAAIGVAGFAAENGWGLLNYYDVPFAVAV